MTFVPKHPKFTTIAVTHETKRFIEQTCVKEYLKHHPEEQGRPILIYVVVDKMAHYYYESWL